MRGVAAADAQGALLSSYSLCEVATLAATVIVIRANAHSDDKHGRQLRRIVRYLAHEDDDTVLGLHVFFHLWRALPSKSVCWVQFTSWHFYWV